MAQAGINCRKIKHRSACFSPRVPVKAPPGDPAGAVRDGDINTTLRRSMALLNRHRSGVALRAAGWASAMPEIASRWPARNALTSAVLGAAASETGLISASCVGPTGCK